MSYDVLFAILLAAAGLWGWGLKKRGFFGEQTSHVDRQAYGIRTLLWLASIVVVSWPLQLYRSFLGDLGYVVAALSILSLTFWLGVVATRCLATRSQIPRDGA